MRVPAPASLCRLEAVCSQAKLSWARFPAARWALVDTSEEDAATRIRAREGHFYAVDDADRGDEWRFAPVRFDHVRLDGRRPVADNVAALRPFIEDR